MSMRVCRRLMSAFKHGEAPRVNRWAENGTFALGFTETGVFGFEEGRSAMSGRETLFLDPLPSAGVVKISDSFEAREGAEPIELATLFRRGPTEPPCRGGAEGAALRSGLVAIDFLNPISLGSMVGMSTSPGMEEFAGKTLARLAWANPEVRFLRVGPGSLGRAWARPDLLDPKSFERVSKNQKSSDSSESSKASPPLPPNLTSIEFSTSSAVEALLALQVSVFQARRLASAGQHAALLVEGFDSLHQLFSTHCKTAYVDPILTFIRELHALCGARKGGSVTAVVLKQTSPDSRGGPREELESLANLRLRFPASPAGRLSLKGAVTDFELRRVAGFSSQIVSYLSAELRAMLRRVRAATLAEEAFESAGLTREPWEKFALLDSRFALQMLSRPQFLDQAKQVALVHMVVYSSLTEKLNFFEGDPTELADRYLNHCEKSLELFEGRSVLEFVEESLPKAKSEEEVRDFVEKMDCVFEIFFEEEARAGRTRSTQKDYLD